MAAFEAAGIAAGLESGEHALPMAFLPEAQRAILSSKVSLELAADAEVVLTPPCMFH